MAMAAEIIEKPSVSLDEIPTFTPEKRGEKGIDYNFPLNQIVIDGTPHL